MDLSQDTIYIILAVGGAVFGVFNFFNKPKEKSDIADAVFNERFTQFDRELANIRDNHLHTIGVKLDQHIIDNNNFNMEVAKTLSKLEAILDERLPNNKN